MPSQYTPVPNWHDTVQVFENGDKGNAVNFKAGAKQLADMVAWARGYTDTVKAYADSIKATLDTLGWINGNNVPQLKNAGGMLEYVTPVSRSLVIPATSAIPQHVSGMSFAWNTVMKGLWARNTSGADVSTSLLFPIRLPHGSVISRIRLRGYSYQADVTKTMYLQHSFCSFSYPGAGETYVDEAHAPTVVETITASANAHDHYIISMSMNLTIDEGHMYVLEVGNVRAPASGFGDVVYGAQVLYTQPRVAL